MNPHEGHDFRLVVEPTESRTAHNENKAYTFRMPSEALRNPNQDVLNAILDTAKVAFSHNRMDSKRVVLTCPEGTDLTWLIDALKKNSLQVEVRSYDRSRFVHLTFLKGCSLACVDRRMDDNGVDVISGTGQLTHAGGPLVLHPDLSDVMTHCHGAHVETLRQNLATLKRAGAPVNRLDYHFGVEGGKGCGMYGLLSSAHPEVKDKLGTPEDVFLMLEKVREAHHEVLATGCAITGTAVGPDDDSTVYNLDNQGDRRALAGSDRVVL